MMSTCIKLLAILAQFLFVKKENEPRLILRAFQKIDIGVLCAFYILLQIALFVCFARDSQNLRFSHTCL